MANVDFTLEDVRKVVRAEFQDAFKPAFEEVFEPYALAIKSDIERLDTRISDGFEEVNLKLRRFEEAHERRD